MEEALWQRTALLSKVSPMTTNINDNIRESFSEVGGEMGQNIILIRGDSWREPVADLASLPTSGNESGDIRQTLDSGNLYRWTGAAWTLASGTGSVTTVSVTSANGVSGTVANATTTPAITITLGAITPTTVNGITLSGASTPTLAVTGTTAVSGTNTGDNATNSQYSGLAASKADVGQTFYIGTTQVAINRASAALTLAGITLTTADIGTPSAGTLTNCTGLPAAGVTGTALVAAAIGTTVQAYDADLTTWA